MGVSHAHVPAGARGRRRLDARVDNDFAERGFAG
jgi:hypothetical protein